MLQLYLRRWATKRIRYAEHLLMAGCYALLTSLLTYPVAFRLASAIAGFQGEDNLQWRWFLWWFKYALLSLHTSVTNLSLLYAPGGGEQPLYAITSFIPALALPLTLLAGATASFNLSFLLAFALTGYTTYLLAYYLTRQQPAAFIAGLIFAFYPARFGYATGVFLGQLTVYCLPLYLLALFMLAQRPTWPRAMWAAVVLACLCLTWPLHVAYGVVVFTLPFLLWQALLWLRRPQTRHRSKYFALAFGLAFVFILGPYWPLINTVWAGSNKHLGDTAATPFSVDLLAFVTPSNYHPILQPLGLLPDYARRVLADRDDIQERLAYLGLLPSLLAVLGLLKFGRKLLFWLLIALAAMILSLGPLLKFNGDLAQFNIEGYVGYIVLPYALLRLVPILDWSGVVGRFNVATMLCLAIMAAYGVAWLLKSAPGMAARGRLRSAGLTVLLTVLILGEYSTIFPFPTQPDAIPPFYYRLKDEAATPPQAIIDLPLSGDPAYTNYSMYYQTVHHQPIAGGHFMRKPAGAAEMIGFLSQLLLPPLNQTVLAEPGPPARLGLLNRFNFAKVIARLAFMHDEAAQAQLAYLSTWLGPPQVEDEVMVFTIPAGGQPLKLTPLLSGQGWQPGADPSQLHLTAPAGVLLYVDSRQAEPLTLQLALAAPEPDRYLGVELDHQPALRLYLSQETLTYNVPLLLPPGAHQLTFYPQEACQKDCSPVHFSRIAFAAAAAPPPIEFANRLALLKSDLSAEAIKAGQPLLVYLYWQARSQMAENYSAFVHLVGPSGELIGQADYLLGGWLYPTSRWPPGFTAAAPSLLFLPPAAPSGQYQLRVGVYQPESGQRLPLAGPAALDSALLATITVVP